MVSKNPAGVRPLFPAGQTINEELYTVFKEAAENLGVQVLRTAQAGTVPEMITALATEIGVQSAAVAPLSLVEAAGVSEQLRTAGLDVCLTLDREAIAGASMGISQFDMAVARLGGLFQDASGLHERLVSMLPPVHLALLPTAAMVDTFDEALEKIEKTYGPNLPPYLSFITGPSKTADIERELTVGVHGPGKLVVVCVDAYA